MIINIKWLLIGAAILINFAEAGEKKPKNCDKVGDICYDVYADKYSFADGSKACFDKGGRLAEAVSKKNVKIIAKLMKKQDVDYAFIGINDLASRGNFKNLLGKDFKEYDLFDEDQGKNTRDLNCVVLEKKKKKLRKVDCDALYPIICETGNFKAEKAAFDWTDWYSSDDPSGKSDYEKINHIRRTYNNVCKKPIKAECRTVDSHIAWDKTGDKFKKGCDKKGLVCINKDQPFKKCQDYEVRFQCPSDVDECQSGAKCDRNAECKNTHGSYFCRCKKGYLGDGKKCYKTKSCRSSGDPHYRTFDGLVHHFMGICNYRFAEPCANLRGNLTDFSVTVGNEHRGSKTRVSFTKRISLTIQGITVDLKKDGIILINGVSATPPQTRTLSDGVTTFTVKQVTGSMEVVTSFGLRIGYDGKSKAEVSVPDSYMGKMCGMCGNYNGDSADDWINGKGNSVEDHERWGNSWISATQADANCAKLNATLPSDMCTSKTRQTVEQKCMVMKAPRGPFQACHPVVDPEDQYTSCYFDACSDPGNPRLLCAALSAYAMLCEEKGVKLSWRQQTGCTPTCPVNEHYEESASGCQVSCDDPDGAVECTESLREGCVCDEGYLRSGTACVLEDKCGCKEEDGSYRTIGEIWFTQNCTVMNDCTGTNRIRQDTQVQCHKNGECVPKVGTNDFDCRCKKGYTGPANNCSDVDECTLGNHACNRRARCVNKPGGYNCTCLEGYTGDGFTCTDIDECKGPHKCSPYAKCHNTLGSYVCTCANDYVGDGFTCTKEAFKKNNTENETCSFHKGATCHDIADCIDLKPSGFKCVCPEGANGDAKKGTNHTGCTYPDCPENTFKRGQFCYKFLPTSDEEGSPEGNKDESMSRCNQFGGTLATILDRSELAFIVDKLQIFQKEPRIPVYLGYTDDENGHEYFPVDFSVNNLRNWAAGEPKRGADSKCVVLKLSTDGAYKYFTTKCTTKYGAVCKIPLYKRSCPDGWQLNKDKCVAVFDEKVTYDQAAIHCALYGADLVMLKTKIDSNFLYDKFLKLREGESFWTGLQKRMLTHDIDDPTWVDGTAVTYNNYEIAADATPSEFRTCYSVKPNKKWLKQDCKQEKAFVCEKSAQVLYRCPSTSNYFNGKCYKRIASGGMKPGMVACKELGGALVSIDSLGVQKFVEDYLKAKLQFVPHWIGLMYQAQLKPNQTIPGNKTFLWADDTPFAYTNWLTGEPKTASGDCGRLKNEGEESLPWMMDSCNATYPGVCEYENTPCKSDKDCHNNGQCNLGQCRCKKGYLGDGVKKCKDINECSTPNICGPNQVCVNSKGSYKCNCIANYTRKGVDQCEHVLFCTGDSMCSSNAKCFNQRCACLKGYEGDGKKRCTDVDECSSPKLNDCHANATCTNIAGSFKCDCSSGFEGDGVKSCIEIPRTCHHIYLKNPASKNGVFKIDADGTGPNPPYKVYCEFRLNMGITVIDPEEKNLKRETKEGLKPFGFTRKIVYEIEIKLILPVVDESYFCYQEIGYRCNGATSLQDTTYYVDAKGNNRTSWGGSSTPGKCLCGEIGFCNDQARPCNCDGFRNYGIDTGKIIDRKQLPISAIVTGGTTIHKRSATWIGSLKCAPRVFDIPVDCHDARVNLKIQEDTPLLIDVDGPTGPLDPFIVYCNNNNRFMPGYGRTWVPYANIPKHTQYNFYARMPGGPLITQPTSEGGTCFKYTASDAQMAKLIQISGGCTQQVRFDCAGGARLLGNDAYLVTTGNRTLSYFGSGVGDKCACGVLGSCKNPASACNCDGSGLSTSDFGFVRNMADLPIKCVVNNNPSPKVGRFAVGPLMCASGPFGLEMSCSGWRERGFKENGTYLIDPDGGNIRKDPNNKPEFLVNCEMFNKPDYGVVVIPTKVKPVKCVNQTSDNLCRVDVDYVGVTPQQIEQVEYRSGYCTQQIIYQCSMMTLLKPYKGARTPYASWQDFKNNSYNYFAGADPSKTMCQCGIDKKCATCNCDIADATTKTDDGILTNKYHLPVSSLYLGFDLANTKVTSKITLGDYRCYDIEPTCKERYSVHLRSTEHAAFNAGRYVVDPDGPLGYPPIYVDCDNTHGGSFYPKIKNKTITEGNVTGPNSNCFNITYWNDPAMAQIKKYAELAGFCYQYLGYGCVYNPLTGFSQWFSYDKAQPGWAGNSGGKECACGEVDKCSGGPSTACNCDAMKTYHQVDHGLILDKANLPVSKVCLGFSPGKAPTGVTKTAGYEIGRLYCSDNQWDIPKKDCQEWREFTYRAGADWKVARTSEAVVIDPDGPGGNAPFTAYCEMHEDPPVGVTVITQKEVCDVNKMTPSKATTLSFTYNAATKAQIQALTSHSSYCEQNVNYTCKNAAIPFDGTNGAYNVDGSNMKYWTTNTGGTGCAGGKCNCDATDGLTRNDNGKFLDKAAIPVSKVQLPGVSGNRLLCMEPLKCYRLYRKCSEIKAARALNNPNGNSEYGIDPDQAGGEDFLRVRCNEDVTEAVLKEGEATGSGSSSSKNINITYLDATPNQLQGLVKISTLCYHKLDYTCKSSGLLGNGIAHMIDYKGSTSKSWAESDYFDHAGCACSILGKCGLSGTQCMCDLEIGEDIYEGGLVTNPKILPLTRIDLAALSDGGTAKVKVSTLTCREDYSVIPEDCIRANQLGYKTGTVLIRPKAAKSALLVYCNMNGGTNKNIPITIIPVKTNNIPIGPSATINYPSGAVEAIDALVSASKYCFQPIRITCKGIKYSTQFSWVGQGGKVLKYMGGGQPGQFCACSVQNKCAGTTADTATTVSQRECNCDIGDSVERKDAGVLTIKSDLPVRELRFGGGAVAGNFWYLGDLQCFDGIHDFNECSTGYEDCSPRARCNNKDGAYDCKCKDGWQGIDSGYQYLARGRSCFDDDECRMGLCPPLTSTCTNQPGTFLCTCNKGWKKTAETTCVDINECTEGTHDCDKRATCINTQGSYLCVCKPGYRGSGKVDDCEGVSTCSCWGDPHCNSFDNRYLNYQGACRYTMLRDQCTNSAPSGTPTFEVVQKNWRQNQGRKVSWVKEVTVKVYNTMIVLKLRQVVTVNGQKISLPYVPKKSDGTKVGFDINYFGKYVRITTAFGLEVKWDGKSRVEAALPSKYGDKVCGVCGNYNTDPKDDWVIGPACDNAGQSTNISNLFGDSWRSDLPGKDDDKQCDPVCRDKPEPACLQEIVEKGKQECAKLRTIFKKCDDEMKANGYSLDSFIRGCEYDYCQTEQGGDVMCLTAASISAECQETYKVTVDWRNPNFCPKKCPPDQVYKRCTSPCQKTCNQNDSMLLCNQGCQEACVCREGLVFDNGKCIDPKDCGCITKDGTYFKLGENRTNADCTEVCECTMQGMACKPTKCHQYAICDFVNDDYGCHCKDGFWGNGTSCTDEDECKYKDEDYPCHKDAICDNLIGSYNCTCKPGYEGDGKKCTNTNECVEGMHNCTNTTEECFDLAPFFECRCKKGFRRSKVPPKICKDKNECDDTGNLCNRISTTCNNTFGSYECPCKKGFYRENDPLSCKDTDECKNKTLNDCDTKNGKCINRPGTYSCKCKDGYEGDGKNCTDIPECDRGTPCPDQHCINLDGSYECRCFLGQPNCTNGTDPCSLMNCTLPHEYCYLGICYCEKGYIRIPENKTCGDKNECTEKEDDCASKNAKCRNTEGSYECDCLDGYTYNPETGICDNINECDLGKSYYNCAENSVCKDTDGGYYCECDKGFSGHCDECRDIVECDDRTVCDQDYATCNNTFGSYFCKCKDGFEGDGKMCADKDECSDGMNNCNRPHMMCVNYIGGYTCRCVAGYVINEIGDCEDENECLKADNGCSKNAACINLIGAYRCECNPGFTGDGRICKPDENHRPCGKFYCGKHSRCVDGECKCIYGFTGDGGNCTDIDECALGKYCDNNAVCVNTPGSFVCTCKTGYVGTGLFCYKEGTIDPCLHQDFCRGGKCSKGKCTCDAGYELIDNACVDIDECQANACGVGSKMICANTPGSFRCGCSPGLEEVKKGVCSDVDECRERLDECMQNSYCVNNFGSHTCRCNPGTVDVYGDGRLCRITDQSVCATPCPAGAICVGAKCTCPDDLAPKYDAAGKLTKCSRKTSECLQKTCDHFCTDLPYGGFKCSCRDGYRKQGTQCTETDECLLGEDDCDRKTSECRNTDGGFECVCQKGYYLNPTESNPHNCDAVVSDCKCGKYGVCKEGRCICAQGYEVNLAGECADINECALSSSCHTLAKCTNTLGSYKCECPKNYVGDAKYICDYDECKMNASICPPGTDCRNTIGAYMCEGNGCPKGYVFHNGKCISESEYCMTVHNCGAHAVCDIWEGEVRCRCMPGFEGDGTQCIDTDECRDPTLNKCHPSTICVNQPGSYVCRCKKGFTKTAEDNTPTSRCVDIYECSNERACAKNAKCKNTIGSYRCACKEGYVGDGFTSCELDSKCKSGGGCHVNATCAFEKSIYQCLCRPGYEGDGVKSCSDIDECQSKSLNKCHKNALCENTMGSYKCVCPQGLGGDGYQFCREIDHCRGVNNCSGAMQKCISGTRGYTCGCIEGTTSDEAGICTDINECAANGSARCSKNAACTNTQGSYYCQCNAGYVGDGVTCDDINECALGSANCDANSMCYNTPGSFDCKCQAGTMGNGTTCVDVDECAKPGQPGGSQCAGNATCKNEQPGYSCKCKAGYIGTGFFCVKDSPCNKKGACYGKNSTCMVAANGTMICGCRKGHKLKDGKCSLFDECAEKTDNCNKTVEQCVDLDDGFKCECRAGYKKVNNTCTDKDECDPNSPDYAAGWCVGSGGACQNTPGTYICVCTKESVLQGSVCADLNECATNLHNCDINADCNDKVPGFTCVCKEGYVGDGVTCKDIDECANQTDFCGRNATCINTVGSYTCGCPKGYELDETEKNCRDKNECKKDPFICGNYATCINNDGGYACACVPGFKWNGTACVDIDECQNKTNPCHENAVCINTPGSCLCKCRPGFNGDGKYYCFETETCPATANVGCSNDTYCVKSGDNKYDCKCRPGFMQVGKPDCASGVCKSSCDDIDECITNKEICHKLAKCTNNGGAYMCTCPDGMEGDGKVNCQDIDECANTGNPVCDPDTSYCSNRDILLTSNVKFVCDCKQGYVKVPGTERCVNKNECLRKQDNDCAAGSKCVDTEGAYVCVCPKGYEAAGKRTCVDIDECARKEDRCGVNSKCENRPGDYVCRCDAGYTHKAGSPFECVDVDECGTNVNCKRAGFKCINTPGSFNCICMDGYVLKNAVCVDVNECSYNPCKAGLACNNLIGTYECKCPPGYRKTADDTCESINECLEDSDQCDLINSMTETTCIDENTGYSCLCPIGFRLANGSRTYCEDINECKEALHNCYGAGTDCVNTYGAFQCNCTANYKLVGGKCVDRDECAEAKAKGRTLCAPGTCVNKVGYYDCTCPKGYIFRDGSCMDINECTVDSSSIYAAKCGEESICKNLPGSFYCTCKKGYKRENKKCVDINECDFANACPDGECYNTAGSFSCFCKRGFKVKNGKCTDENECKTPNICGDNVGGYCVNRPGTYKCRCLTGYENTGSSTNTPCRRINECVAKNVTCPVNSYCKEALHGYTCDCKAGYKADSNSVCRNINECNELNNPCHMEASCTDTIGSYFCRCKPGYVGDGITSCQSVCETGVCKNGSVCHVTMDNGYECKCTCSDKTCRVEGEVCDNLGMTHASEQNMITYACKLGEERRVAYYHACKDTCDKINCPEYRKCQFMGATPTCICRACTSEEYDSGPVCTKMKRSFANACDFVKSMCNKPRDDAIESYSACKRPIACQVTEWGVWTQCSATCGVGRMTRDRTVIRKPQNGGSCPFAFSETDECYSGPCKGCEQTVCHPFAYCVHGKCQCPFCFVEDADFVCGKTSEGKATTYLSLCAMRSTACHTNKTITFLHRGKCGDHVPTEPLVCSLVTKFEYVKTPDGCTSVNPIRTNLCGGGCGTRQDICCRPTLFRPRQVLFKCKDNSRVIRKVKTVGNCDCIYDQKYREKLKSHGNQVEEP